MSCLHPRRRRPARLAVEEFHAFVDDLAGAADDERSREVPEVFDQENREYVAPIVEEANRPGDGLHVSGERGFEDDDRAEFAELVGDRGQSRERHVRQCPDGLHLLRGDRRGGGDRSIGADHVDGGFVEFGDDPARLQASSLKLQDAAIA